MIKPFEFYFDFGSPYSFLAHKQIRKIESDNSIKIKYIPILLGGLLKLAGKEGARQVTKQIIKTDPVAGKPEWFDALVTKVINEGTDVTKNLQLKTERVCTWLR